MNRIRRAAVVRNTAPILIALTVSGPVPCATARSSAPDFKLSATPAPDGLKMTARPPAGHHFNLEAPMSATGPLGSSTGTSSKKSGKSVLFHFSEAQPGIYSASIYLCDDAQTFCERKTEQLVWSGAPQGGTRGEVSAPAAAANAPIAHEAAVSPNRTSHGFLLNRADEAFRQAKAQGKPLLVDFFGIWCPPCNLLDEKVFKSPQFAHASQGFIKLKLDVDTQASWPYTSRYKVSGYPTVIFLTPEGEEISRIVGYRPLVEFKKAIREAYAHHDVSSLASLEAAAQKGDREAADRAGLIRLNRGEYSEAAPLLEGSRDLREKYWDARVGMVTLNTKGDSAKPNLELVEVLKKAIAEFPESPDSVQRRMDLAEQLQKSKQDAAASAAYRDAIATAERIATQNPGITAQYDSSPGDLWVQTAESHEALSEKEAAIVAYRKAAIEYRKHVSARTDRGGNLELAYCLWKSGDVAGAETIYQRLEKAYPKDFTFYLSHAKMNLQLQRLEKARELAEHAHLLSYGSNHLDSAFVLAKVLKAQNHSDQARVVIDQALATSAKAAVPTDTSVREYRAMQRLEDFRKQLS